MQALKERIRRIGSTSSPTSVKRKRIARKSVSPSNLRIGLSKAISPSKSGKTSGHAQVKFVKMSNEEREGFHLRVVEELSKIRKREIEKLCAEKKLTYELSKNQRRRSRVFLPNVPSAHIRFNERFGKAMQMKLKNRKNRGI